MAAIVPVSGNMNQSGDRSFSVTFTSTGAADTLSAAALAALLYTSSIRSALSAVSSLADMGEYGMNLSLVSSVAGSAIAFDGANFLGFAAGDHLLRVSMSYSASA